MDVADPASVLDSGSYERIDFTVKALWASTSPYLGESTGELDSWVQLHALGGRVDHVRRQYGHRPPLLGVILSCASSWRAFFDVSLTSDDH